MNPHRVKPSRKVTIARDGIPRAPRGFVGLMEGLASGAGEVRLIGQSR